MEILLLKEIILKARRPEYGGIMMKKKDISQKKRTLVNTVQML